MGLVADQPFPGKTVIISQPESEAAKDIRGIAESVAVISQNNILPINIVD
jgi:hypothetical protein